MERGTQRAVNLTCLSRQVLQSSPSLRRERESEAVGPLLRNCALFQRPASTNVERACGHIRRPINPTGPRSEASGLASGWPSADEIRSQQPVPNRSSGFMVAKPMTSMYPFPNATSTEARA